MKLCRFTWRRAPRGARRGKERKGSRVALSLERLEDRSCPSITFVFDYSLDASGFFNAPAARAVLQQAGQDLGAHLGDALAPILPGGGNHWTASFTDPGTGGTRTVTDLSVGTNAVYVFAGGRNYGGTTIGEGGYGGWSAAGSAGWLNTVAARGQGGALGGSPTDVGPWGGSVSFDVGTYWSFGGAGTTPGWNQYDFYSVALHELGHVLGLGTAPSWTRLVSGGRFLGPNAYSASDTGTSPLVDGGGAHWAAGTTSGGAEADMTPYLAAGLQKHFTPLDWAGLADIGWQVDPSLYQSAPPSFGSAEVHTGPETVGAFDPWSATWYLRNELSPGAPDQGVIPYGGAGWVPVAGDWNGDGVVSLGVFDPGTGTWYLRNSNTPGGPDYTPFQYGAPGWVPVVGDWLGTGHTGIGVFDPGTGTWYLRNTATPGGPDIRPFQYGGAGWRPVVGDWLGTGHTGIGVFNPVSAVWYLRNTSTPGGPDLFPFQFGGAGWLPVVGDWTGSGHAGIGVVNPATETWYLRNAAGLGSPDYAPFSYGAPGWLPVVGDWVAPGAGPGTPRRAPDTALAPNQPPPAQSMPPHPFRPCCGCPACLAAAAAANRAAAAQAPSPAGAPAPAQTASGYTTGNRLGSSPGGADDPLAEFRPFSAELIQQLDAMFASYHP